MSNEYPVVQKSASRFDPSAIAAGSALRVLVVEDEPAVAEGVRLLLEQDYDVVVAGGGEEALRVLSLGGHFDAVLCDLMMPRVSGIDLHRRLAAERPGMEHKMVFMTGGAFTVEAEDFLASVGNPQVHKPFTFESLDATLKAVARQ